jgi:hypothetical protein
MDNPYSPPSSPLRESDAGTPAGPSRTISRWLLAIELLLIAVPATLLLAVFGLVGVIPEFLRNAHAENSAHAAATIASLAGLASGWILGVSFVVGGRRALAARRSWLWYLAVGGGVVAILGLGARFVPAEPYTPLHSFLDVFGMFALGLPLWLPLLHLGYERWRTT